MESNPNDTTPVKKASDEYSEQPTYNCAGGCKSGVLYTGKNAVGEPSYVDCPFCDDGAARTASRR